MTESDDPKSTAEALRKGPLHPWHCGRGAIFGQLGDYRTVLHYGDPGSEAETLARSAGLLDRSAFSRLELVGADRTRFLNGLTTIDIPKLTTGQGGYGYLTAVKGGILADMTVFALEDRLWLDLPPGRESAVRAHLEKYVVADRVEVVALDEMVPLAVLGAGLDDSGVAELAELPAGDFAHARVKLWGSEVHVTRTTRLGMPGLVFWVSASIADLFAEDLLANVERPDGGKLGPVGIEAWQQQRIRSGLPLWGVDFDDRTLPQELDSARGLDFEKGCYLGQEVIARLHYRGQTPRQLRRLQGDSPTRPAVGTEVLFEERAVGTLTSVASASDGGWIGLSRLARRAFDPETRVEVVGVGTARVLG